MDGRMHIARNQSIAGSPASKRQDGVTESDEPLSLQRSKTASSCLALELIIATQKPGSRPIYSLSPPIPPFNAAAQSRMARSSRPQFTRHYLAPACH
jgi:hypothetical protein